MPPSLPVRPYPEPLDDLLPSPDGLALAIMEACARDDASVQSIARLVEGDPALAARVLRQANLSLSRGRPVASVPEAVARIGLVAIRQLALAFSVVDQSLQAAAPGFDFAGFWNRSVLRALMLRHIADDTRVGAADELFACGLLSRIGELARATAQPSGSSPAVAAAPPPAAPAAANAPVPPPQSTESVSLQLLSQWGLPLVLVEPLCLAGVPGIDPYPPGSRMAALQAAATLADLAAGHLLTQMTSPAAPGGVTAGGSTPSPAHDVLPFELLHAASLLGLPAERLLDLLRHTRAEWLEWKHLLGLPSPVPGGTAAPAPSATSAAGAVPGHASAAVKVMAVGLSAAAQETFRRWSTSTPGGIEVDAIDLGPDLAARVAADLVVLGPLDPTTVDLLMKAWSSQHASATQVYLSLDPSARDSGRWMQRERLGMAYHCQISDPADRLLGELTRSLRLAHTQRQLIATRARLRDTVAELAQSHRSLQVAALTDEMTGLPNRRAGRQELARAWSLSSRHGHPVSVLMIDIDHFKAINDRLGHAGGDEAIARVGRWLQSAARREDTVSRWGGEEFLVVCPGTGATAALEAARRYCALVREGSASLAPTDGAVTVSVGAATRHAGDESIETLLQRADTALYRAKHAGRNRAIHADQQRPDGSPPASAGR